MSTLPVGTERESGLSSLEDYLFGLMLHGVKLGFRNIEGLLESAGHPERSYPTVHVAGTNGKGSVVALLKGILCASEYRTGCFTSPHLIDVCERFQVDGECISPSALSRCIELFRGISDEVGLSPTFFEMNTAIAFGWFREMVVDLALIEVGLGGRLDSTNVISPEVSVITNIDLEHTKYLGDTLEKIAFEKAGILKAGVPVVIGETREGPLGVILARAAALGSPAFVLGRDFRYTLSGDGLAQKITYESSNIKLESVPLGLRGSYQGSNAAVAIATAERLMARFSAVDSAKICRGISSVRWPCRLERMEVSVDVAGEGKRRVPVVIDVAHNTAGAEKLAEEVGRCVTILAIASDKDAGSMLRALVEIARPLILTTFEGKRGLPVAALCDAVGEHPYETAESIRAAIGMGISLADEACPLLITGSNITAGEARKILIEDYGAPELRF
jgi:dihydrofolate synthase/folylpolyglutamate synthase